MRHFLLTYDLAPDYLDRRGAFREEHLRLAWQAQESGALVLGGATDPAEQAILLFQGESAGAAEDFARNDPYVANGIVRDWRVREWKTVVGEIAASPVRPAGAT